MESDEEPWGFRDDESPPRYQPETEDLTGRLRAAATGLPAYKLY